MEQKILKALALAYAVDGKEVVILGGENLETGAEEGNAGRKSGAA
jgi:hypothetical protein